MSVTFGLPISVQFLSDLWFIGRYLSSVFRCARNVRVNVPLIFLRSLAKDSTRDTRIREGEGSHADGNNVFAQVCAWNDSGARCIAPSRGTILGPGPVTGHAGGDGEMSYADHEVVWPSNRYWNSAFDPTTYLWKGFLEFCHYESTQIREYD